MHPSWTPLPFHIWVFYSHLIVQTYFLPTYVFLSSYILSVIKVFGEVDVMHCYKHGRILKYIQSYLFWKMVPKSSSLLSLEGLYRFIQELPFGVQLLSSHSSFLLSLKMLSNFFFIFASFFLLAAIPSYKFHGTWSLLVLWGPKLSTVVKGTEMNLRLSEEEVKQKYSGHCHWRDDHGYHESFIA